VASGTETADLVAFLLAIDGTTRPFGSGADR
jgi:hypothetical protein